LFVSHKQKIKRFFKREIDILKINLVDTLVARWLRVCCEIRSLFAWQKVLFQVLS